MQKRAVAALEAIVRASRGEVLVVAHGGVNRCLLCHLLGMPLGHLFRLGQEYACLNLLDFSGDTPTVARVNLPPSVSFDPFRP